MERPSSETSPPSLKYAFIFPSISAQPICLPTYSPAYARRCANVPGIVTTCAYVSPCLTVLPLTMVYVYLGFSALNFSPGILVLSTSSICANALRLGLYIHVSITPSPRRRLISLRSLDTSIVIESGAVEILAARDLDITSSPFKFSLVSTVIFWPSIYIVARPFLAISVLTTRPWLS